MPQELLPGINIVNSSLPNLPDKLDSESYIEQPFCETSILAEGSNTPPYPEVIDDLLIEREVRSASQELLTYISTMRKQAETKYSSECRSTDGTKSARERRP